MKGSLIYTKGLQEQIETLKTEIAKIKKQRQESETEMYKKAYWVLKNYIENSKQEVPEYVKELIDEI
jgi:cell division protein FtsB